MMNQRFAVVGNPVAHSLSPFIHQAFAKQTGKELSYITILGDELHFEQQVREFFAAGGAGLNITLPFKERAFRLADNLSERCRLAGAANTLWWRNDRLHADNTDGLGLVQDLAHYLQLADKRVLLLGAGGAARGIIGPLFAQEIKQMTVINRNQERLQSLIKDFPQLLAGTLEAFEENCDVIINATPASLSGQNLLLPDSIWKNKPFCYDLAYTPNGSTPFVAQALAQGCHAIDGLGMLVEQAAEAFYIWHGIKPETQSVLRDLRGQQ